MSPEPNMVHRARLDRGLTQREMAFECGVSLTTVQGLEAGRAAIPRNAKKVADFIGCAVTDLPFYDFAVPSGEEAA